MPFGLERKEIPWFPRIDESKCLSCQECINFCPHEVLEWENEKNHPRVVNPYNCVVGCSACARICPSGAISFPSLKELREMVITLRREILGRPGS